MYFHIRSIVHLLILLLLLLLPLDLAVDELFFNSCRVGDISRVKEYLDSGVHVSIRDAKGNTGRLQTRPNVYGADLMDEC